MTEAFSITIEIFCPCVATGIQCHDKVWGWPGLGRDKDLLISRQSFIRGGTFLSRHETLCL